MNPERESAQRLAHTLGSSEITDYMALGGAQGIARVRAPYSATGHAIGDLDIGGPLQRVPGGAAARRPP